MCKVWVGVGRGQRNKVTKYGEGPRRVQCPWAPNVLATPLRCFLLSTSSCRSQHSYKYQQPFSTDYGYSYYPRAIRVWNQHPASAVNAPSLETLTVGSSSSHQGDASATKPKKSLNYSSHPHQHIFVYSPIFTHLLSFLFVIVTLGFCCTGW